MKVILSLIALLAVSVSAVPAKHRKRCTRPQATLGMAKSEEIADNKSFLANEPGTETGTESSTEPAASSAASPASEPASEPASGPPAGSGKCPPGFINVAFNSDVNNQPDFNGRFKKIQDVSGADRWLGFSITPPANGGPDVNPQQVPILMNPDPTYMAGAMDLFGKMEYTITFNEPDMAATNAGGKVFDPATCAEAAKSSFLKMPDIKSKKLIGPGPAYPGNGFSEQFFQACDCLDDYHAVGLHVYTPSSADAINMIDNLANNFPGKPIWITEIAPASDNNQGCQLREDGVKQWMTDVLGHAATKKYQGKQVVERIFWNFAEAGSLDPSDPGLCNSHLTTMDGQATPILTHLGTICS